MTEANKNYTMHAKCYQKREFRGSITN